MTEQNLRELVDLLHDQQYASGTDRIAKIVDRCEREVEKLACLYLYMILLGVADIGDDQEALERFFLVESKLEWAKSLYLELVERSKTEEEARAHTSIAMVVA